MALCKCTLLRVFVLKTARPSTTLSRQDQIAQCTAVAHCCASASFSTRITVPSMLFLSVLL
jgi:hypothetical protein